MQMSANEITGIHIPLYTKVFSEMRTCSNAILSAALQEDDA